MLDDIGPTRSIESATDDPGAASFGLSVRDRVSFAMAEVDKTAGASAIAALFRDDLRNDGLTLLPALPWSATVRMSWFGWRFHAVRFEVGTTADGWRATIRSRHATQGLAWRVHKWLYGRKASDISWHTSRFDSDGRATPM